jgi:hypothetical protein
MRQTHAWRGTEDAQSLFSRMETPAAIDDLAMLASIREEAIQ